MIITVSGPKGSGVSTTARDLASAFGMKYVSMQAIARKKAEELGTTEEKLREQLAADAKLDLELERRLLEEARGNAVVDAKLAGWKVEKADLRIFLYAPLKLRASRVAKSKNVSLEEAAKLVESSEKEDKKRFQKLYNVNIEDVSVYDLIINTAKWDSEGVQFIVNKAILKIREQGN